MLVPAQQRPNRSHVDVSLNLMKKLLSALSSLILLSFRTPHSALIINIENSARFDSAEQIQAQLPVHDVVC
jgi:hypothetical protein